MASLSCFFKRQEVQQVLLNHLLTLPNDQIGEYTGLLSYLVNVLAAKPIADKYLNSLLQAELYTNKNINLLSSFTKSIDEPAFKIFYNPESAAKVDAAIVDKGEGWTKSARSKP